MLRPRRLLAGLLVSPVTRLSSRGIFAPDSSFWGRRNVGNLRQFCEAAGRFAIVFKEIVAISCLTICKSGFIKTIMEVYDLDQSTRYFIFFQLEWKK